MSNVDETTSILPTKLSLPEVLSLEPKAFVEYWECQPKGDALAQIQRSFATLAAASMIYTSIAPDLGIKATNLKLGAFLDLTCTVRSYNSCNGLDLVLVDVPQDQGWGISAKRESEAGCVFEGLFVLPEEIPDISFVVVSDAEGDIGNVFLSGEDLMESKSWDIDDPNVTTRKITFDEDSPCNLEISFVVWPYTLDADIACEQRVMECKPDGCSIYGEVEKALDMLSRFKSSRNQADLRQAIIILKRILSALPSSVVCRLNALMSLSEALRLRFESLGDIADIDNSIVTTKDAILLIASGEALEQRELSWVMGLHCTSLERRFKHTGNQRDIEQAFFIRRSLIEVDPGRVESIFASLAWCGLANSLTARYKAYDDAEDYAEILAAYQTALLLLPPDDSSLRTQLMCILGTLLITGRNRQETPEALEEGLTYLREGLRLTSPDHPHACAWLSLPGISALRLDQYRRFGADLLNQADNAKDSIGALMKVTLGLMSLDEASGGAADQPLIAKALTACGLLATYYFAQSEGHSDIQNAIVMHQQVISGAMGALKPNELAHAWCDLGVAFMTRYAALHDENALEAGIVAHREANRILSPDSEQRERLLCNLGISLTKSYRRRRLVEDLDDGLGYLREGLSLTGIDHPQRCSWLMSFSSSLIDRYWRFGELMNLNEAIATQQKALQASKGVCRERITDDLVESLIFHYKHTQEMQSLYEALKLCGDALISTPHKDAPLAKRLTNFSDIAYTLFMVYKELDYLRNALRAQQKVVDMNPGNGRALCRLGIYYKVLFTTTNALEDIQKAVDAFQEGLSMFLPSGPDYPPTLHYIGHSLALRFTVTHDIADLQLAVSLLEESLALLRKDIQSSEIRMRILAVLHLASALETRYDTLGDPSDLNQVISLYSSIALEEAATPMDRIYWAQQWARLLLLHKGPTDSLDAFNTVVELLSDVAGMEQTVHRRHEILTSLSEEVLKAAVTAIEAERVDKGVEWLEQGRGLVWAQLNSLRTPPDALKSHSPILANRLEAVCQSLEVAGGDIRFFGEGGKQEFLEASLDKKMMVHEQASSHLELAKERKGILDTIRTTVPGFENFLQPLPCSSWLKTLPESGPVVLINVNPLRCDAIALLKGADEPLHIPLPNFSYSKAKALGELLKNTLFDNGLRLRGYEADATTEERAIKPRHVLKTKKAPGSRSPIEDVLHRLWMDVVKPIVDALALSRSADMLTRVWWCPTGPLTFLPLHAAGIYRGDEAVTLSDYAVSSYIPTLAVLAERVRQPRPPTSHHAGILLLSEPGAPGSHSLIPGTTVEVDRISELLQNAQIRKTRLDGEEAITKAVLQGMEEYSCVHLACHATQNAADPLQSGFVLRDGRLDLSTIIKSDLKIADFAFLSACQTSTGTEKLSEEAVHLAAGMLTAGYRGVVATMWSIQDRYAGSRRFL